MSLNIIGSEEFQVWYKNRYPFWDDEATVQDFKDFVAEIKTRKRIDKLLSDTK